MSAMHFGQRGFQISLLTLVAFTAALFLLRSSLCPVMPSTMVMEKSIVDRGNDLVKDVERGWKIIDEDDDDVVSNGKPGKKEEVKRKEEEVKRMEEVVKKKEVEVKKKEEVVKKKEEVVKKKEEVVKKKVEDVKKMMVQENVEGYPGGSNPKNVWVVSNRRSGTHMTMDVIAQVVKGPLRIFKTNHVTTVKSADLNCECLQWLKSTGKIVHAYRDVRDVIIAMYYYQTRFDKDLRKLSLKQYLNGSKGYRDRFVRDWVKTTGGWFLTDGVLNLNYDETVTGMPYVYDRIAGFLDSRVKNWNLNPKKMQMVSGVVNKGAGKGAGGWTKYMSSKASNHILKLAKKTAADMKGEFLRCGNEKINPEKKWNMTNSYEIAGNSGLRAPAICPQKFLGHSSYILTHSESDKYRTKKGSFRIRRRRR